MRLKSIVLKNFKQYYGEQPIEFAGSSEGDPRNVTVVYGENGRGKTTLYRALMFGLYGDTTVEQDEYDNNRDSVIYNANLRALDESRQSGGRTEVSVTIEFTHEDASYEIRRSFYATMDANGNIVEDRPSVRLSVIRSDGNVEVLDDLQRDDISDLLNAILDERVKNYFLFDGERIERLTKATKRQREEIQKGIKNLLKIDNLFMVKAALEENRKTILNELKQVSTGDMLKNIRQLEETEQKIAQLQARRTDVEHQQAIAEQEKADIDLRLKDFAEKRPLLEQMMQKEAEIAQLETDLAAVKQHMVDLTPTFATVLLKDAVGEMIMELDEKQQRGEVPSEIKTELIDRILSELTCICGREIQLGSDAYEKLLQWKQVSNPQVIEKHAMSLFGSLREVAAHIPYETRDVKQALAQHTQLEEQFDVLTNQLESLKNKVGDLADQASTGDFEYRDNLIRKIAEMDQQLRNMDQDITDAESERTILLSKQRSYEAENEVEQLKRAQLDIAVRSLDALDGIIERFEAETREELHAHANRIFASLIDDAGKANLSEIIIRDNYTLDVLDWGGRPFLANISAGQRQIVSLAFITALAEVAGGSSALEIPLFMDTPFGRLSPDHRSNLVNLIPNITPQWILLVTGSEFGPAEEAAALHRTGHWGKLYMLESDTPGVTRIRESSPEELTLIRR